MNTLQMLYIHIEIQRVYRNCKRRGGSEYAHINDRAADNTYDFRVESRQVPPAGTTHVLFVEWYAMRPSRVP